MDTAVFASNACVKLYLQVARLEPADEKYDAPCSTIPKIGALFFLGAHMAVIIDSAITQRHSKEGSVLFSSLYCSDCQIRCCTPPRQLIIMHFPQFLVSFTRISANSDHCR